MIQLPQKFQSKTSFQASDKKKIKEQVFIYLVTQIKFYSKNLQLKPNILWFYCIELFKRIPKHPDLLFYEFFTNWYWISKITANYYKEAPKGTIQLSLWLIKEHPGFSFLSTRGPWPGLGRGTGEGAPNPGGLCRRRRGGGARELERTMAHL